MTDYGKLAATGASLTAFGYTFSYTWLVILAVVMVVLGALCVKFGYRRNKGVGER